MNSKRKIALAGNKRFLIAVGAIVATCAAAPLSAQIVTNGSFESPTVSGSFAAGVTGSSISGWTIAGNVDHIGSYWNAQHGVQSVDLNGTDSMGRLTQTVSLTGGQPYQLSFWMSGNPDSGPALKTMIFGLGSTLGVLIPRTTASFDSSTATGGSSGNMNWAQSIIGFTPTTTGSYLLAFVSTTSNVAQNSWGPALDNVSVTAVPEPETWAMMLAGLSFLGWMSRRRRQPGSVAAA